MFLLKCLFPEQCRGGKFLSGLCKKKQLNKRQAHKIFCDMGTLLGNEDLKKWQNLNTLLN